MLKYSRIRLDQARYTKTKKGRLQSEYKDSDPNVAPWYKHFLELHSNAAHLSRRQQDWLLLQQN
jgi:hypothetical protein